MLKVERRGEERDEFEVQREAGMVRVEVGLGLGFFGRRICGGHVDGLLWWTWPYDTDSRVAVFRISTTPP